MKKILIYIDSLNASGGIERVVYELISKWRLENEVDLLTKDEGGCFYGNLNDLKIMSIQNPKLINMKNRFQRIFVTFKNMLSSVYKLKKINVKKYDYFYVTTPLNAFELIKAGVAPQKVVVSEHGSAFGVNKVYQIIKKYIYPKVYCITVPNKMDLEFYKDLGANAIYVPHFLYFKNKPQNNLESKIILNCGRLTADKRQIELLKIWNQIQNKNGWRLYIVGDGEEKNTLKSFITNNKMEKDVIMLPAQKNIEEIYKKASIFAFTSRFEGFGLVIIEAMSYGIPCVSFDCPSGPRDIIKNEINGYLIENNNNNLFATQLEKMINLDQQDLKKLGNNAYIFANKWNNEKILEKWKMIFS